MDNIDEFFGEDACNAFVSDMNFNCIPGEEGMRDIA